MIIILFISTVKIVESLISLVFQTIYHKINPISLTFIYSS